MKKIEKGRVQACPREWKILSSLFLLKSMNLLDQIAGPASSCSKLPRSRQAKSAKTRLIRCELVDFVLKENSLTIHLHSRGTTRNNVSIIAGSEFGLIRLAQKWRQKSF